MSYVVNAQPKAVLSERVLAALGGFWPAWLEGASAELLGIWAEEFARFPEDQVLRAIRTVATRSTSMSPRIAEVMAVIRAENAPDAGPPRCVAEAAQRRAEADEAFAAAARAVAGLRQERRQELAAKAAAITGLRAPDSMDVTTWSRMFTLCVAGIMTKGRVA